MIHVNLLLILVADGGTRLGIDRDLGRSHLQCCDSSPNARLEQEFVHPKLFPCLSVPSVVKEFVLDRRLMVAHVTISWTSEYRVSLGYV